MLRDRDPDALPFWITDAASSVLASFGKGIAADQAAVAAALTQPWSNARRRARSPSSNSCGGRCMAAATSISSVPASLRRVSACTESESEPRFHAD